MGKKNTQKTISVPSQIENVENLVAELVDFVCGSTKLDARRGEKLFYVKEQVFF